jgi:hypothetical protein
MNDASLKQPPATVSDSSLQGNKFIEDFEKYMAIV